MAQLKDRALKLEKQTAWLWYEKALATTPDISASTLFMLVKFDILKQPPAHIWKRIEQGHNECELKREDVQEELDRREKEHGLNATPERMGDLRAESGAFVSLLAFMLWQEAPRECRASDGESVLLGMLKGWLKDTRADVEEWPLATVKAMLKAMTDLRWDEPEFFARCVQFVQGYRA